MKTKALIIALICISARLFAADVKLETFSKSFKGNIGKYKITLYLTNRFTSLGGNYFYDKSSDTDGIELDGSKTGNKISMANYSPEDKLLEKFTGSFINDSTVTGIWSNGKKRFPFRLTEVKSKKLDLPENPDFEGLRKFYLAEPWENHFFEKPIVIAHMKRMLKNEYFTYLKFLEEAGCYPTFLQQGQLFYQDFSYLHIGCMDQSLFVIDEKTQGFYLCWIKDDFGKTYLYSDKANNYIPQNVLQLFTDQLNVGWGHVYTFKLNGNKITATAKDH
jgi:hypothetical protein